MIWFAILGAFLAGRLTADVGTLGAPMSTNRTKTDWAYKQAQRIIVLARTGPADSVMTRQVASLLRRVYSRGQGSVARISRLAREAEWGPDKD